jgi:hypothetical protein
MNSCKRNSAVLIAVMLLVIFSGTQSYADPTFANGGRQIGRGFADIFRATGSAFKKSGKAVGRGFKQAGKETGGAFKQMGKDIARAFSGKN